MKGLSSFWFYILPCGTRDMKCNADISLEKSLSIIFSYMLMLCRILLKAERLCLDPSSGSDGV